MSDIRRLLEGLCDAFNAHDLDAIMSHFEEDCVFEAPRGPDRWGRRFVGKDEVRRGLAARPTAALGAASRSCPRSACSPAVFRPEKLNANPGRSSMGRGKRNAPLVPARASLASSGPQG